MKKKTWIRVVSILLASAACASPITAPVSASEVPVATATQENTIYTGKIGVDYAITWTYNPETETITFSGTGSLMNADNETTNMDQFNTIIPSGSSIKHVIFEEGIEDIGWIGATFFDSGFYYDSSDYTVTLPEHFGKYYLGGVTNVKGLYGSQVYYDLARYKGVNFEPTGIAKEPLYETSGTCKEGATWEYNYATHIITISGPGYGYDESDIPITAIYGYKLDPNLTFPEEKDEENGWNKWLYDHWYNTAKSPVYCYKDSQYAKEYEICCDLLDKKIENAEDEQERVFYTRIRKNLNAIYLDDGSLCGDINMDGFINLTDAVLLGKAVNDSITVTDAQKVQMDCNGDGDISADDMLSLLRFLTHKIDTLPENAE